MEKGGKGVDKGYWFRAWDRAARSLRELHRCPPQGVYCCFGEKYKIQASRPKPLSEFAGSFAIPAVSFSWSHDCMFVSRTFDGSISSLCGRGVFPKRQGDSRSFSGGLLRLVLGVLLDPRGILTCFLLLLLLLFLKL